MLHRRRFLLAAAVLAFVAAPATAQAQVKLEASYSISAARIPIGSASATIDLGKDEYTIAMNGRAKGILRVLTSGDGVMTTHGALKDNRPVPMSYSSKTVSD